MLARAAAGIVGVTIVGCLVHSAILTYAGGFDSPTAPTMIGLALGLVVGSAVVGICWRQRRIALAILIGTTIIAGEAYNLILTAERTVAQREIRQAPLLAADIVLCPDGKGSYWLGKVVSEYVYAADERLPHRRRVEWMPKALARVDMSDSLRGSCGSIGTVSNISKHAAEIERFLSGNAAPTLISTDELVEDASVFALEKHLEEFLVENWATTELGKTYNIFTDEGEPVGQQYLTDTGSIDILALRKDGKELLVVELKKGRASDAVVGQIQRYMGYVMDELAEPNQAVRGCIIALEDDIRLRRALRATTNIDFYRYEVSFKLLKV